MFICPGGGPICETGGGPICETGGGMLIPVTTPIPRGGPICVGPMPIGGTNCWPCVGGGMFIMLGGGC